MGFHIIVRDGEIILRATTSTLSEGYGAVQPRQKPEDFRALRDEFEQGVADDVMDEMD
jgi:hypothetical protein